MLKSHWVFLSIVYLLTSMIASCGTSSSTTSITSTSSACPQVTSIPVSDQTIEPNMYFILYDNTIPYNNDGFFEQRLRIIPDILPRQLNPGDRIVGGWLDQSALGRQIDDIIFFDRLLPNITSQESISLVPSLAPFASPTVEVTPYTQLGQSQLARTQSAFDLQVTATSESHNCRVFEVNQSQIGTATAVGLQFGEQAYQVALELNQSFEQQREPHEEGNKPILEVLTTISEFSGDECEYRDYEHCILIVFSDMLDYRSGYAQAIPPSLPHPQLNYMNLIIVLFDCQYPEGRCAAKIDNWTRHLTEYGAESINFILNSPTHSIPSALDEIIGLIINS